MEQQPIYHWPLNLARKLYSAGAIKSATPVRSSDGTGWYVQFNTAWGDRAVLTGSGSEEGRKMTALRARTVIAADFPMGHGL